MRNQIERVEVWSKIFPFDSFQSPSLSACPLSLFNRHYNFGAQTSKIDEGVLGELFTLPAENEMIMRRTEMMLCTKRYRPRRESTQYIFSQAENSINENEKKKFKKRVRGCTNVLEIRVARGWLARGR